MNKIATISRTKEIIEKNSFRFKKGFGQNFLIDLNILEDIVKASGITKEYSVIEIGPGIGSLTEYLIEYSKKVVCIEIDKALIPILEENLAPYDNYEIINTDALKSNIHNIIEDNELGDKVKIVANLPYYITTPIIMDILERKPKVESVTVMVQKEVAKRFQAAPRTKDYGALTLAVNYYSEPHIDFYVPPTCFMPKPNVDSAVVTLKIREKPPVDVLNEEFLFSLIRCGFEQRRKTFVNAIFNIMDLDFSKEELGAMFEELGFTADVRAETLDLLGFAKVSNYLYEKLV